MAIRAAILLSRQPLRPCGRTSWVRQLCQAVTWVKQQQFSLLSSIGMQTWEMVTALASINKIPVSLYLPEQTDHEVSIQAIQVDYQLTADKTNCILVPFSGKRNHQVQQLRDSMIVEDADVVIPISIRRHGRMESLLGAARSCGKQVIEHFLVNEQTRPEPLAEHFESAEINPAIDEVHSGYVIHWTRASNGKWPGERSIDYYRAIIESKDYPQSGFETLRHILRERRIYASSRHMPKHLATVCLSSLAPRDVVPLMRWRARYAEMSFEPYGIGIRMDIASALGIRPVRYHDKTEEAIESGEIWLSQSIGEKSDWRQEREYRHLGDLSLLDLPHGAIHLICRSEAEAEILAAEFTLPTTNLFR